MTHKIWQITYLPDYMLIIIAYYFLAGIRVNAAKYNYAGSVCTRVDKWKRKGGANNGCWQQEGIWGVLKDDPYC